MRFNEINLDYIMPLMNLAYRLWMRTLRIEVVNFASVAAAKQAGRQVVLTHWHGETFCLPHLRKQKPYRFVAIVSQSKDGEIMARMLESLGLVTARGSASRGGVRALVKARRTMLDHEEMIGVVTIDGPRGPRHEAKEGAVYLANKTNAMLAPVRIFISSAKVFEKAWDKFMIPFPFSRVRIVLGDAYDLEESGELSEEGKEIERARLQERMLELKPEW